MSDPEALVRGLQLVMRAARDGSPPTADDLARLLVAPESEHPPKPAKPRRRRAKP